MLPANAPPLLVMSDVHLNYASQAPHVADLARLVHEFPRAELVLAGDVFDLSRDPPRRDPAESIVALLRHHRSLFDALRSHLSGGGRLTLIAGNHDAAVADHRVREALLDALDLTPDAPLETEPWFVRRGRVHIEHGHLYDPDNAPAHPLALWSYATEPLGIALTRRFLAPTGALDMAHAHETTPVAALVRAFELFGARAPLVVARYFATAIRLCAEAGRQSGLALERQLGEGALDTFARQTGLPKDLLAELANAGADPTHHRFTDTFMRLYFDRVVATLSLLFGASTLIAKKSPAGAAVAAVSGAYLGRSLKRKSRYSGIVEQRLREAAGRVAERTDAELVIFGHTHREDAAPRYLNSGSFAYSRTMGRPYILLERGREPECRYAKYS
jgi:UDP-2,3-diacylglucosamine pyrophosphatase LpxH